MLQNLQLFVRLDAVERHQIDEVAQHPGALDVTEELVAESATLARALDESGDVGHHEFRGVIHAHDAEVRFESGERVVRDLRLRGRHGGDERALPRVREPD